MTCICKYCAFFDHDSNGGYCWFHHKEIKPFSSCEHFKDNS